ncbi:MAG: hypothetical protein RL735_207, partial [Pseudomonadota bacterium]
GDEAIHLTGTHPKMDCRVASLLAMTRPLAFLASFRLFHLTRSLGIGPVAQWLEPAAHNGLVAGSSPAGPTIFPARRSSLTEGNNTATCGVSPAVHLGHLLGGWAWRAFPNLI